MQFKRKKTGLVAGIITIALLMTGAKPYTAPIAARADSTPNTNLSSVQGESETKIAESKLKDYTKYVNQRRQQNSDAIGWLYIPNTGINDVVLHNKNNNMQYLSLDFNKEYDKYGSICSDRRTLFQKGGSRENLAQLSTLYAHSFSENPSSGSGVFSGLKYYRDPQFAKEHPYLYFSTYEENMAFEVIAVLEAHIDLKYNHIEQSTAEYAQSMRNVLASSLYDYSPTIYDTDKLLVLSTCAMKVQGHDNLNPLTTDYRFVVVGKLVPPNGATKTNASFRISNPVPPDTFRGK